MNAFVIINGRKYDVVQGVGARHFDYKEGTIRLHVTDKSGHSKMAQFHNGEFELWDTPKKRGDFKYGRTINMKS